MTIEGVGVHPGYAKGVLVNALRIGAEFVAALPNDQAPETTEGREGYLHPHTLTGTAERAEIRILLRDFTDEGMDAKRQLVRSIGDELATRHPGASVSVEIVESYRNMRRYIEDTDARAITFAHAAAERLGIELVEGARPRAAPTARGSARRVSPAPTCFTGGHDFHSRFEWNTVQNLEHALAYTKALVQEWGTA